MSLINRAMRFAQSRQGKQLISKASAYAQSPKGKARIAQAKRQLESRPAGGGRPPAR
jgi:hypothetical protein